MSLLLLAVTSGGIVAALSSKVEDLRPKSYKDSGTK